MSEKVRVSSIRRVGAEKTCGHRHRSGSAAWRCLKADCGLSPDGSEDWHEVVDADTGEVVERWQTLWVETATHGHAEPYREARAKELLERQGPLVRYHASLNGFRP